MNVMRVLCSNCAGTGKQTNWKAVKDFGIMEEIVCGACGGTGWTEYATFTLDEAKAILEHCGLSTEG